MWDGRFTEVDTETIDYAAVARGLNCKGISIRDPRTLREELKTALELEGPVVIDITTAETEACKFTDDPKAVALSLIHIWRRSANSSFSAKFCAASSTF